MKLNAVHSSGISVLITAYKHLELDMYSLIIKPPPSKWAFSGVLFKVLPRDMIWEEYNNVALGFTEGAAAASLLT